MAEVIGVRFKNTGKVYYFDPGQEKLSCGERVIVETARGVECGEVAMANREVNDSTIVQPLRKLVRKATKDDLRRAEENRRKEKDAFRICEEKIAERGLEMKLVEVEYTFDNSKGAGKGSGKPVPHPDRAAADRRAGRGENAGRHGNLRQAFLLRLLFGRLSAGIHQNGKGAGPFPEPGKDLRGLRQAHVLPEERGGDL